MSSITPCQIRGARGMLDWSMTDLARAAGASISTMKRVEDDAAPTVSPAMLAQIQNALEAAGIEFLADDGNGPGLRLRLCQPLASSRLL